MVEFWRGCRVRRSAVSLLALITVLIAVGLLAPELALADPPLQAPAASQGPSALEPSADGPQKSSGSLAAALPARWDWREHGLVTRMQDQGACQACYAFSALGSLESQMIRRGQPYVDLSENHVAECNYEQTGCNQGNIWIVTNLLSVQGAVAESCDPWNPADQVCKTSCEPLISVTEMWSLSGKYVQDVATIKQWVYDYGPLSVDMDSGSSSAQWKQEFENYDGSYTLHYPSVSTQYQDHLVLLIGWDDNLNHAGGKGAWIVKNSWGTSWGGPCGYGTDGGYFTISYGSAALGGNAATIQDWIPYDARCAVLHLDEAGVKDKYGWAGSKEGTGLVRLTPQTDGCVSRIELWTLDAADVDVAIYDAFDGTAPSVLKGQRTGVSLAQAGYHSIALSQPVSVKAGDDVFVRATIRNKELERPLAIDTVGPASQGRSYVSPTGTNGTWTDLGATKGADLGIRLRVCPCEAPTATPTATVQGTRRVFLPLLLKTRGQAAPTATPTGARTATPTRTPTVTRTATLTPTPTATETPVSGWITIVEEGFEGAFPTGAWELDDWSDDDGGEYLWGPVDTRAHGGRRSAWPARSGADGLDPASSPCPANLDTEMTYGPFDLSNAVEAKLSFWFLMGAGDPDDMLAWLSYGSEGDPNFGLAFGGLGTWQKAEFNLTAGLGQAEVWVGIKYTSGPSGSGEGAYMDDVLVRAKIRP